MWAPIGCSPCLSIICIKCFSLSVFVLQYRVRLSSFPFFFFDLFFLLELSSTKQLNDLLDESHHSVQDPRQQDGPDHGTQGAPKGRQSSVGLFEGEDSGAVEGNLVGLANADLVGLLEGRRVGRTTGNLVGRPDGARVGRATGVDVATGDVAVPPVGMSVGSCVCGIAGRTEGGLVVLDRNSWLGAVGRRVGADVGDAEVGCAVGKEVGMFVGIEVSMRQRVSESSISISASVQTRSAIHR